ncbi:hypothetical protein HAX54_017337, partial [Datura stramonium]|nr:hypothetical protein [Datura stramonium]
SYAVSVFAGFWYLSFYCISTLKADKLELLVLNLLVRVYEQITWASTQFWNLVDRFTRYLRLYDLA